MGKASVRRGRLPRLEERFEFRGDGVNIADVAALRSAVFPVFDKQAGLDRALRIWRKTGGPIDADLRKLWLHERRQVQRLMSSAHAAEFIVGVVDFVEDNDEFGVVLEDAGASLSRLVERATPGHWLRNLAAARPRAILWRNFRRLVRALGLLHAQGLVHGHISADVIFTHGSEEPDFKLSGFEWSLWFAAPPSGHSHPELSSAQLRAEIYSFAADWRNLGWLVAQLLGVRLSPDGNILIEGAAPHLEVTHPERRLLRRLVSPLAAEALDATTIMRAVDDIATEVARAGAVRAGTFIVLIPESANLGRAVSRATDGAVAQDERREQIDWASSEMLAGATLFVPDMTETIPSRLTLGTSLMTYNLRAFREQGGEPSWDIAVCNNVSFRDDEEVRGRRGEAHELSQQVAFVTSPSEARILRAKLGPAALDWSTFAGPDREQEKDETRDVRRALMLVQLLEAFMKAMDALPVEVIESGREHGLRIVVLRAAAGSDRDEIVREMGASSTADNLRDLFENDGRENEMDWWLGPSPALGGQRQDVNATFLNVVQRRGLIGYRFELDEDLPQSPTLFLRSQQDSGTERVIRRRLANIAAMADQPSVAEMLDNPWLVRRTSHDVLDEKDASFQDLDGPKQEALRSIWQILPIFLVVGPPGVGKTRLATEVVRKRFASEPSSRILLTAQGHDALDNLQQEVAKVLAAGRHDDALVVRSVRGRRPGQDNEISLDVSDFEEGALDQGQGPKDITHTVAEMLSSLSASDLADRAPPPVRARLAAISAAAQPSAKPGLRTPGDRRAIRAMVNLVEDAANVVVSTVNSSTVERLVEERSLFDTVLIEEAAKVTGPELAGALALSGRSLLIGDDRQLQAFEADRLERMLDNHALVARVVSDADSYVGIVFAETVLADLLRVSRQASEFERLKGLALRLVQPFATIVREDERRLASMPKSRRLSATLTEQRRMHPAIAEVVSKAFYRGELTTAPTRTQDAFANPGPVEAAAPLPSSPIVVVDFEHVSRSGKSEPAERDDPRWHNPGEVEAVMEVLKLVRAAPGTSPTLAILSPYRAQVSRLTERLDTLRAGGHFPNLDGFAPVRRSVGMIGTVDSFQGAEADLVVVSLVRNNARTGRSALGFLRDARRMNVLLSRAKFRLILVGSLRFLREAIRGVNPGGAPGELDFLSSVLNTVAELQSRQAPNGIPFATVVRPDDLRRSQ
jgi:hypothetical protein